MYDNTAAISLYVSIFSSMSFFRSTANRHPRFTFSSGRPGRCSGLPSVTSVGISKLSRQVLCFSYCEKFFADRSLQRNSSILRKFRVVDIGFVLNLKIVLICYGNGQQFWGYVTGTSRRGKTFYNHLRNYDCRRIYVSYNKLRITYDIVDVIVIVIICCLAVNSPTTVNHSTRKF